MVTKSSGSLALLLHAHLPFVRHPEHEEFHEEDWLFEAVAETYIPLLRIFRRLASERIPIRLTFTMTPTVCAMLRDQLLQQRTERYLERGIELSRKEIERTASDAQLNELARFYSERFVSARDFYLKEIGRDVVGAFAQLQEDGLLEIITCAATHGFLPLMEVCPEAMKAQVFIGRDEYRECFGRDPAGIWLPECGYIPAVGKVLQDANVRWTVLDAHGLMFGEPRPRFAIFSPYYTPAGPAVFGRDRESSKQVWSAREGYPGDPAYRDFYRDIGKELPEEYLGMVYPDVGHRRYSGIKYHRITGSENKEYYRRDWAMGAVDAHANHFLQSRVQQIEQLREMLPIDPIVLSPFDAELFGHWWFEGPEFLELFLRKTVFDQKTFHLTTPTSYLFDHPTLQMVNPSSSSWGNKGYWEVWLDPCNSWIYPHLHGAAARMTEMARKFAGTRSKYLNRLLKQMARELLLAQSSDWAFLMKTRTAPEYAEKRTRDHLLRFTKLYELASANRRDEEFLAACEQRQSLSESELALLRLRKILLALFAGLLPGFSSQPELRFAFAVPETEGRISLGVFDSEGRLKRTLYVNADETDFVAGLNGLIATWDGKDDAGQALAAGQYKVRGYLVPEGLKSEGVAYHFNDWIDDEKSPRIKWIHDLRRQPGGFVVLAEVSDGKEPVVFRFDQLRGLLWTKSLNPLTSALALENASAPHVPDANLPPSEFRPRNFFPLGGRSLLAASENYVTVLLGDDIYLLSMDSGTTIETQKAAGFSAACVDASGDDFVIGAGEKIARIPLPELAPAREEKTPVAFEALAVNGKQLLGAAANSSEVWYSTSAEWKKLPLNISGSSISFGLGDTFWMTAKDAESGELFTGQFNMSGEFLRAYRDEYSPIKVCASTSVEEIAVLERQGSAQRLRVLSLVEQSQEAPATWAVAFEKVLWDCSRFGVVEEKLVPDAGDSPQRDEVEVMLATGGLTNSSRKLTLRVTEDKAGLWLETRSGLRLAFLVGQPSVRRVVLRPGKQLLTVYAGDGAVVAEYAVRGLGNIVEIDAGEVELR